ncbi:uncharacterized protein KNN_06844 (plasmid) [Bacillus thuringiensis serovar tolworthi]|uniref:Uncharacterized protein n=3 Tax=Bacillus thuringiensis TaxID=1428 RepID=A0A9W4A8V2_BACTO|nr:hypothetical protein H175_107p011 [Bacillus thuringiensis serovar thuringiensis str. IS5056]ERH96979.1 Ribbon-helix-helix domain protein [Bacillus thuringiensis T01-328]BAR87577.1 uncharacterized protein KNN_06844 [Bacillus thuringiensis serovar tolworthi]
MATPNRNSSPTYRWTTHFTRLRKENSFGKFVKKDTNIPKTRLLDQAVSLLLLFQSNSTNAFISEMNELKEQKGLNSSELTDYILNSLKKE